MRDKKRLLCFLTVAALSAAMTGCGSENTGEETEEGISTTIVTTTAPKSVSERGSASLGETVSFQNISGTVKTVYCTDYTFLSEETEVTPIFFEMTIQNESEQEISMNILSGSFAVEADDTAYAGLTLRAVYFITCQFGSDAENFNDAIQPGETRTGYVCIEAPADFESVTLTYFPAAGLLDRSQSFAFRITREEMESAPEPITAFSIGDSSSEESEAS